MTEQIEHYLALVTIAMPVVLGLARGLKAFARHLRAHALTTPSTADDAATERLLAVADWIDVVVSWVARAATLGLVGRESTPALERFERQTLNPDEAP